MYDRMHNEAQGVMREEQAELGKDRGCFDHLFFLWYIIEQCAKWQKMSVLIFIEFKKDFDSVHRASM